MHRRLNIIRRLVKKFENYGFQFEIKDDKTRA